MPPANGDAPYLGDLPHLRDVIRSHGLWSKRRLGQHFLLDANLLARIVRAAGDLSGRTVLEIGPGPGGLTRAILTAGAGRLIAIERDPRCVEALADLVRAASGRLELIEADALDIAAGGLADRRLTVIANLPYNVGTALLTRWMHDIEAVERLVVMFQKEVAQRIVAAPGSSAYGRLSVLCQLVCHADLLFDIPPNAFVPPPKVHSSLVRLVPREDAIAPDLRNFVARITGAAFGQRRKMLRTSLKGLNTPPEALLDAAGIAPTLRADAITTDDYRRLALALRASRSGENG